VLASKKNKKARTGSNPERAFLPNIKLAALAVDVD
jgi:hypothetical protein